jgi:hypothetical protein
MHLLLFILLFLTSCASVVHTKVTSVSAIDGSLKPPLKIFWITDEDDLLKRKLVESCKKNFHKNSSSFISTSLCPECLTVEFSARMGGSDTYSTTSTRYNYQNKNYDSVSDTDTDHERIVELKFYKNKQLFHQIRAVSWGSSSRIEKVLPEMCKSIGEDFPIDRDSKLYEKVLSE